MDPARAGWASAIAALADEPGAGELLRPGALLLVWSLEGGNLLWTSRPEAPIETVESELSRLGFWGAERLRTLGRASSTRPGFRLERWRVATGSGMPSVTVACRQLTAERGERALLTMLPGGLPIWAGGAAPSAQTPSAAQGDQASRVQSSGSARAKRVRVIWRMDADGRFRDTPDALARGVGASASDVAGLTWSDLVGPLVTDPGGTVTRHLASRSCWRRAEILWRDIGRDRAVPVEISGAPVVAPDGSFAGFRGFALVSPDEARSAAGLFDDLAVLHARRPGGKSAMRPVVGFQQAIGTAVALTGTAAALTGTAGETVLGVLEYVFGSHSEGGRGSGRDAGAGQDPAAPEMSEPPRQIRPAALSAAENGALHELARALGASTTRPTAPPEGRASAEIVPLTPRPRVPESARILDRLPIPVAVLRDEVPVFANRALLDIADSGDVASWVARGGIAALLGCGADAATGERRQTATLRPAGRPEMEVAVERAEIAWGDAPATLVSLVPSSAGRAERELKSAGVELAAGRRRTAELQAGLDLAADGVVTIDLAGRILSLSRTAEALFGYAANELAGEVATVLIAPDDHRQLLDTVEAAGRLAPGSAVECEVRGRLCDGVAAPYSVRVGIVAGPEGPTYFLAFRDISAFKTLERELREARLRAEQAGANRADFLARVSHEIRTPLTAITGFAELMLDERFGPLGGERYKGYARDIQSSGGHVISLVNDLLDLAKASSGSSDLAPAALDLNEIARHCVALCLPLATRERTILRTSFDRAIPPVWADERSVRQIALNVLSNAIRYTGAGGQVIISTASPKPGEVRLSVRDTGPGMNADEIEAALTPFRQVPATRRGGGTGLGLPLSKALAEANGGGLTIAATRGQGTLVAVHLPEADPSLEATTSE